MTDHGHDAESSGWRIVSTTWNVTFCKRKQSRGLPTPNVTKCSYCSNTAKRILLFSRTEPPAANHARTSCRSSLEPTKKLSYIGFATIKLTSAQVARVDDFNGLGICWS